MSTNIYGHVCNYRTGDTIRTATRADWLRAKRDGDPHTWSHQTDEFGDVVVYVDGPEEDPEPWLPLIQTIVEGVTSSLEDGVSVDAGFSEAHRDLFGRAKPACFDRTDEHDFRAWGTACELAARVGDMCATQGSVRAWLDDHEIRAQDDDRLCRTVEVESDLLRDAANLTQDLRQRGA